MMRQLMIITRPGCQAFCFFIDCNKSTWWNRIPRSKLNNGIYIASSVMQMHHEKLIRTRKPTGKMKFMCSHDGSTVCEQYLSMTINRAHWFACAVPALQQINTKKKPEQNRNNSWDWDTHTHHTQANVNEYYKRLSLRHIEKCPSACAALWLMDAVEFLLRWHI